MTSRDRYILEQAMRTLHRIEAAKKPSTQTTKDEEAERMIICSEEPLAVASRIAQGYGDVTDIHLTPHDVPFLVIREATFDEYLDWCRSQGVDETQIASLERLPFHYLISVD